MLLRRSLPRGGALAVDVSPRAWDTGAVWPLNSVGTDAR